MHPVLAGTRPGQEKCCNAIRPNGLRRAWFLGFVQSREGSEKAQRFQFCNSSIAGPQATHAGDSGPGQQDGEDRLGAHGARRILQSSGPGGVNRHGLRSSGGRKVRREVWRNGQRRGRENQGNVRARPERTERGEHSPSPGQTALLFGVVGALGASSTMLTPVDATSGQRPTPCGIVRLSDGSMKRIENPRQLRGASPLPSYPRTHRKT